MTTRTLVTADELLRMPSDGKRYELIEGKLIELAPAGLRRGEIAATIALLIGNYVRQMGLGSVFVAGPGFFLQRDPDTVRAPDVAFIAKARLSPDGAPAGFSDTIPDLVVEVVSPNDRAGHVQEKIEQWIEHGVKLVWVAYPECRSITVYRSLREAHVHHEGDTLTGDPVIPGFSCSVTEIF
ncbi:MAG: Uma2 family endonuclease [Chloroflexi bacterium]|nr:Uma2 family endonuclease [Chloroflexota bacterium]